VKNWIVFAKKPFGTPKSVVEYLGRYSHKIAISNHRIIDVDNLSVMFSYKDYRQNGAKKHLTLNHQEFIRRFAMHILPKRFVKIRHYGFLSSTWKRQKLKIVQLKLNVVLAEITESNQNIRKCACCKKGNLMTITVFDKRGPPPSYFGAVKNIVSSKN
jgi:Putative transposase